MLGGCAGPSGDTRELPTSSDQTDAQKRGGIHLELAVGYYQQQQLTVALDEIKQALQAAPNLAEAYSMRGLIYMDMGMPRLADENFTQALRLSPHNPDFNNNYGLFLCQNGRAADSIAYFEAAIQNRAYQSPGKALNNAGVCSLKLNDIAAAERYFSEAFRYEPGNSVTNTNLARIYYNRQDYERARLYITRASRADVVSAETLWLAIKIEHKFGDRASEASLATQLQRRYPNSVEYASYQRGAFND
jgi:type IV pilus assembly protein PilF